MRYENDADFASEVLQLPSLAFIPDDKVTDVSDDLTNGLGRLPCSFGLSDRLLELTKVSHSNPSLWKLLGMLTSELAQTRKDRRSL